MLRQAEAAVPEPKENLVICIRRNLYLHIILGQVIRCQTHRTCKSKDSCLQEQANSVRVCFGFCCCSSSFFKQERDNNKQANMQASQNNGLVQPMHPPKAAFPWAAGRLRAQQVLCYCHGPVMNKLLKTRREARKTLWLVSQLLINPHGVQRNIGSCAMPCNSSEQHLNSASFPEKVFRVFQNKISHFNTHKEREK